MEAAATKSSPPWTLASAHKALLAESVEQPLVLPTRFDFSWRGGQYRVYAEHTPNTEGEEAIQVRIDGALGTLPYSSENRPSRIRSLAAVRALQAMSGPTKLHLIGNTVYLRHSDVYCHAASYVLLVTTATQVLAGAMDALAELEPCLYPLPQLF